MTKPCPYCAEEIQENAIKCRFCGEWIEKPAEKQTLGGFLSNSIAKGINKAKHLTVEDLKDGVVKSAELAKKGYDSVYNVEIEDFSDSEPFVFKDLIMYPSYFKIGHRSYQYTDVTAIDFKDQHVSTNMVTQDYTELKVYGSPAGVEKELFSFGGANSNALLNLGAKKLKKIRLIGKYFSKMCYTNIEQSYLIDLNEKGFISYGEVKIYQNGNIEKSGITINLVSANKEGKLWVGVAKSGLFITHKPGHQDDGGYKKDYKNDPYKVMIKEGGLMGSKIIFQTHKNTSVIQRIILDIALQKLIQGNGASERNDLLEDNAEFIKGSVFVFKYIASELMDHFKDEDDATKFISFLLSDYYFELGHEWEDIYDSIMSVSIGERGKRRKLSEAYSDANLMENGAQIIISTLIMQCMFKNIKSLNSDVANESIIQSVLNEKSRLFGLVTNLLDDIDIEGESLPIELSDKFEIELENWKNR